VRAVVDIGAGKQVQVGLVGQGLRDIVGERATGAGRTVASGGRGEGDLTVQAEPVEVAGVKGVAQHPAHVVEHDHARDGGDGGGLAIAAVQPQGLQAVAFPMPVVGGEALHVLGTQQGGIVAALGRVGCEERAELDGRSTDVVERCAAARAIRGTQPRS
jgi:hypothetical protein